MMTKKDLVDRLIEGAHGLRSLHRWQVESMVNGVMTEIIDEVTRKPNGEVKFVGFGTFKTKVRPARIARVPVTGEKVAVPEKTVVIFRPGHRFKAILERSKVTETSA